MMAMAEPHEGHPTILPASPGGATNRFPHWQTTLIDMLEPHNDHHSGNGQKRYLRQPAKNKLPANRRTRKRSHGMSALRFWATARCRRRACNTAKSRSIIGRAVRCRTNSLRPTKSSRQGEPTGGTPLCQENILDLFCTFLTPGACWWHS
jgi:hypothetical protein